MWMTIWRYVVVPLLVWLLTHSYSSRRHSEELHSLNFERIRLEHRVHRLRERLGLRDGDDDEHRPFFPWRDDGPRLPAEVVGEHSDLTVRHGL